MAMGGVAGELATLPAQGTRAAVEPGSGAASVAGDNRPAWMTAGKVGAAMGGAASEPAALSAQGTRAATEPGSGAAAATGHGYTKTTGAAGDRGQTRTKAIKVKVKATPRKP